MVDHMKASGGMSSGGPGIVVLSPSLDVLHMNRQSQVLMCNIVSNAPEGSRSHNLIGVIHPVLIDLADKTLHVLRDCYDMGWKGPFEVRHVAEGTHTRVLIRGIGLPNANGLQDSRIVLVLAELSVEQILRDLPWNTRLEPQQEPQVTSSVVP
jgi:hypothetical protein